MWDSVRSTWPEDGPGVDSLVLGSWDNTSVLPAAFAPLWSSNLVDLSSHCPLGSIQNHLVLEGRLWSLACQCILWGNKANCLHGPAVPSWNSVILGSALVLFVCILWGLWTFSELVQWKDTRNSSCLLLWTYLLALQTKSVSFIHTRKDATYQEHHSPLIICFVQIIFFWLFQEFEWELSHYFVTLVMKYDKNEFSVKDSEFCISQPFCIPSIYLFQGKIKV